MDDVELVKRFLRGQNLEQVGRLEEAVELYESAVEAGFDSTGPYDRLIAIYSHRAQHAEVVRVAERALESVRTHDAKRAWYGEVRDHARRAAAAVPQAAPRPARP
jgi:tetratricopeptide (TPR) repeat protein